MTSFGVATVIFAAQTFDSFFYENWNHDYNGDGIRPPITDKSIKNQLTKKNC